MTTPTGNLTSDPELAAVRDGEALDWDRLSDYLRAQLPWLAGDVVVQQFPKGSANLTYLVSVGDTRLVVRRPPFGEIAPGAHDMRREFRATSGLSTCTDQVPRPYLFCDDPSVVGSDFLVTEFREGIVIWDRIPASMASVANAAEHVGFAVVDALAGIHLIRPADAGLHGLGRPQGFVARQVSGWQHRWSLVDTGRVPGAGALGDELGRGMPPQSSIVSVLHNDFKLDNCQFDPTDPTRVKSIFDWDMATLGDPLVDLGTLLNYWPDPSDVDGARPVHVPGMETMGLPTRRQVIERYTERTGFDTTIIAWYEAFATWKTAVVMEQLYQRWVRGESSDPRMKERGEPVPGLVERAAALLRGVEPS
jgi:aminoglycoside phosphotransferase (APT) family kinase protein